MVHDACMPRRTSPRVRHTTVTEIPRVNRITYLETRVSLLDGCMSLAEAVLTLQSISWVKFH